MIKGFKNKIFKAVCGGLHNLAIDEKGNLYSWGRCEGGQLGLSRQDLDKLNCWEEGINTPQCIISDDEVADCAAGVAHSVVCTTDGTVYTWGWGNYGQLGLGFTGENYETGTGNQASTRYTPTRVDKISERIVRVYAGSTFTMFLTDQNELYACGMNDLGQLGIDTS